jgi:hypothetical protein
LLVIGLAAGIGWIGHEGGALTHGKHHYDDLNAIGADWLPGVFGEGAILGEPAKPAGADAGNPHAPKANGDGENAEDTPDNNAEPDADANSDNEADESKVGQTSDET